MWTQKTMSDFLAEKGAENSPPLEGWQAKPDGVVIMRKMIRYMSLPYTTWRLNNAPEDYAVRVIWLE